MARLGGLVVFAALIATGGQAETVIPADLNTYRYGGTYSRFASTTPELCARICSSSQQCMAWSFGGSAESHTPACELKQLIGRSEYRPGWMSGLSLPGISSTATPVAAPAELSVSASGLREKYPDSEETYVPISQGMEVAELMGASRTASALPAAPVSAPRRAVAPSQASDARARQSISWAPQGTSSWRVEMPVIATSAGADSQP